MSELGASPSPSPSIRKSKSQRLSLDSIWLQQDKDHLESLVQRAQFLDNCEHKAIIYKRMMEFEEGEQENFQRQQRHVGGEALDFSEEEPGSGKCKLRE